MTDNGDNEFVNIMQELLGDYAVSCSVEFFDGQIIISDDMKESYLNLRKDLVEKGEININNLDKYHGLTVQPSNVDGLFTILLNKQYILESISKNNVDWIGTLIHEAVHVNDFKLYFNIIKADSYDELYHYNPHRIFLYWTEFHARAIGHYFLRKYALEDFKNSIHLDNLINVELPFQIDYLITQMNTIEDPDSQMYTVVHFLGRLATWRYIYPETFNEEFISGMLNSNPWMEELFYLLIKYESLEEIYPHFNDFELILDKYFS